MDNVTKTHTGSNEELSFGKRVTVRGYEIRKRMMFPLQCLAFDNTPATTPDFLIGS